MVTARRVVVSGVVQGVFFRDECRATATRLGVAGWVRNRHDGRVEAHFEGDEGDLEAMVAWCHEGPPRAHVDRVEVEPAPVDHLTGFAIRPSA